MNESSYDLRAFAESHIEVHKFHGGAIVLSVLVATLLQSFLPIYISKVAILDLPLLITIYFGLSRRNPSTGLLLGTAIGLLQDSLSKNPIGLFGISKTVIGYLASSIGARLDTEHPAARFALTAVFFVLHQGIVVLIHKLLLAQSQPWFTLGLGVACLVNSILGVFIYFLLDRLRKS
jgi:rod shape-determining protein MreD